MKYLLDIAITAAVPTSHAIATGMIENNKGIASLGRGELSHNGEEGRMSDEQRLFSVQDDRMTRMAAAQQAAAESPRLDSLLASWGRGDSYATINTSAFRPGEVDKLRENDKKLEDCRKRRKAAILRASRMVQGE